MAGHDKNAPGVLTRSSWHTMVQEKSQKKKERRGTASGGRRRGAPRTRADQRATRPPPPPTRGTHGGRPVPGKDSQAGHGRHLARTLTAQVYPQWGLSRPRCAVRVGGVGEEGG